MTKIGFFDEYRYLCVNVNLYRGIYETVYET